MSESATAAPSQRTTAHENKKSTSNAVRFRRHISQEAQLVLTSLRNSSPPQVGRGDIAHALEHVMDCARNADDDTYANNDAVMEESGAPVEETKQASEETAANVGDDQPGILPATSATSSRQAGSPDMAMAFLQVVMDPRAAGPHTLVALRAVHRLLAQGTLHYYGTSLETVTTSVLACKFEQTNAGADEAVEMAIADVLLLLMRQDCSFSCPHQPSCGCCDDEAHPAIQRIQPATYQDAFNTVFVTRNTFVHSPALCYHFEDVLTNMVTTVFDRNNNSGEQDDEAARLVLELMVQQLLHATPLVGGGIGGVGSGTGKSATAPASGPGGPGISNHQTTSAILGRMTITDESTREAQVAHDATRVMCLRLIRVAIGHTSRWKTTSATSPAPSSTASSPATTTRKQASMASETKTDDGKEESTAEEELSATLSSSLLKVVQEDLCLALLMTGQAIWAYHDDSMNISPGFVSLEVLSEICVTLSLLWNTLDLRRHLMPQFESILTGFYQRALVLLRKRRPPVDSVTFNANLVFDAEVEIILESLVDILCLHDHGNSIADGDGGALETMFAYYDCHMRRSDVAIGLMVELCRCCGGTVDQDGHATLVMSPASSTSDLVTPSNSAIVDPTPPGGPVNNAASSGAGASTAPRVDMVVSTTTQFNEGGASADAGPKSASAEHLDESPTMVHHPWRQIPAHLKELCAQALMGGMKCLFHDDKPSAETKALRAQRKRSIMKRQQSGGEVIVEPAMLLTEETERSAGVEENYLRSIKAKKRLMRKAARIFNQKSSRGIEFLVDAGLVPDPVTPESIAIFLRNGIVVGLDKKEVGAYLGEAGKGPAAGKNPPCWQRDWFHKDVLKIYCSLFRFEGQRLIDGLRMFLACFRLPGEAQQIDRILQAFSDSCGQVCDESASGSLKLFSDDPKRASDTAYLLSFSIIMLNTDLHNENIREDRKMKLDDFVKNNTDYGRDITEKGKEFPRAYLKTIYDSIRDEEIRTEGEGADGAMTVERWKDVLRGSTEVDKSKDVEYMPSAHDAEDLTELVLEHVWMPIVSSIGAFWGIADTSTSAQDEPKHSMAAQSAAQDSSHMGGMLGVQGARLGMDMAFEMLAGVRHLGRIDIFRKIFACVCTYTDMIGPYMSDSVARTWLLTNSVEAQSAIIVALRTALESAEHLDIEGWKRAWSILFELRDLKCIAVGGAGALGSLLHESDADLLSEEARRDWTMCLIKGDMSYLERERRKPKEKKTGVLGAFGRALFGSDDSFDESDRYEEEGYIVQQRSPHGKGLLVVWNETAPSDDEASVDPANDGDESEAPDYGMSPGAEFEDQLIRESIDMSRQVDQPVTGLERADETRHFQTSPRSRVRVRLSSSCNLKGFISESRYMNETSVEKLLLALVDLVAAGSSRSGMRLNAPISNRSVDLSVHSDSSTAPDLLIGETLGSVPLSPASEAFAEVLICEIALKNKDRLKDLWEDVLRDHYMSRLAQILVNPADSGGEPKVPVDPGLEKRVTGLVRLSVCAVSREDLVNEILPAWKYILPMNEQQHATSPIRVLDRHMSEGLWRIVADVDGMKSLNDDGWEGLLSLMNWNAKRAGMLRPLPAPQEGVAAGLAEDDPALQTYRSLHLVLNAEELNGSVPCLIVGSLRSLASAGWTRNCPQLSVASLDLLHLLYERKAATLIAGAEADPEATEAFFSGCWKKIVEGIADAAEKSPDSNVRQHALSMLTDLFLDKQGSAVPIRHLCGALSDLCVPLAGRCIVRLQMGGGSIRNTDELMIEFELCIGLIFKPLRHHLQNFVAASGQGSLSSVWTSVLTVLEELLKDGEASDPASERRETMIPRRLKTTMNDLVNEHLQNAIMVLISAGVLLSDSKTPGDITNVTWESVSRMGINPTEWKAAASQPEQ